MPRARFDFAPRQRSTDQCAAMARVQETLPLHSTPNGVSPFGVRATQLTRFQPSPDSGGTGTVKLRRNRRVKAVFACFEVPRSTLTARLDPNTFDLAASIGFSNVQQFVHMYIHHSAWQKRPHAGTTRQDIWAYSIPVSGRQDHQGAYDPTDTVARCRTGSPPLMRKRRPSSQVHPGKTDTAKASMPGSGVSCSMTSSSTV